MTRFRVVHLRQRPDLEIPHPGQGAQCLIALENSGYHRNVARFGHIGNVEPSHELAVDEK